MEPHSYTMPFVFLAAIFAFIASVLHQRETKLQVDYAEAFRWYRRILLFSLYCMLAAALFFMTGSIWVPLILFAVAGIYFSQCYSKQIKGIFEPEILIGGSENNLQNLGSISVKAVLVSTLFQGIGWVFSGLVLFAAAVFLCMLAHNG